MKKLLFCFALCVTAAALHAQVSMKMILNQRTYLQYEPLYVKIGVRNMSAHPLAFGESKGLRGTLRFDIIPGDGRRDRIFPKDPANMPSLVGLILPPGGVQELTYRISDYYDLRSEGEITVKAVLSHPQLSASYESPAVSCRIVKGMNVWGPVTVGVPDSGLDASHDPDYPTKIKTRNYRIVSYFTGKVTVYALVIDDKTTTYLVRRIGFDLGPNLKPICEIDFLSRLNVMVAASPGVFAYYQYNTDGGLERRQVFIKTSSTPTLVLDKETGIVMPAGGREARKDVDFEELKDLPFLEDVFGGRRKRNAMDALNEAEGGELPAPGPRFGK